LSPRWRPTFPALPHWACAGLALILMVIAVELLALLIDHFGHHE
jgi:hypothetical protein